jgi:hypothetical protein
LSAIRDEAAEQLARLRVLWPVLNQRPEHTQEIVKAVIRHEHKLAVDDVVAGFSNAIENAPTNGWPPGPHEVLDSILKAAQTRKAAGHGTHSRRDFGGLTFAEWWHTLPADEKPKHDALYRLMHREPEDVIEWEDAA